MRVVGIGFGDRGAAMVVATADASSFDYESLSVLTLKDLGKKAEFLADSCTLDLVDMSEKIERELSESEDSGLCIDAGIVLLPVNEWRDRGSSGAMDWAFAGVAFASLTAHGVQCAGITMRTAKSRLGFTGADDLSAVYRAVMAHNESWTEFAADAAKVPARERRVAFDVATALMASRNSSPVAILRGAS